MLKKTGTKQGQQTVKTAYMIAAVCQKAARRVGHVCLLLERSNQVNTTSYWPSYSCVKSMSYPINRSKIVLVTLLIKSNTVKQNPHVPTHCFLSTEFQHRSLWDPGNGWVGRWRCRAGRSWITTEVNKHDTWLSTDWHEELTYFEMSHLKMAEVNVKSICKQLGLNVFILTYKDAKDWFELLQHTNTRAASWHALFTSYR